MITNQQQTSSDDAILDRRASPIRWRVRGACRVRDPERGPSRAEPWSSRETLSREGRAGFSSPDRCDVPVPWQVAAAPMKHAESRAKNIAAKG
ncbi:hypothetical protein [Burkholderia gladioli]|uniref:hypothetical protein n=1 Tax=Burkholderia gladioli TaxID=28095 RepID=UPI00163F69F7|nr:hypothetical protein [Burkholderia gladioli]